MSTSQPVTYSARDITFGEETEVTFTASGSIEAPGQWIADFSGHLSTGEEVVMSRSGATAKEAREKLVAAMLEQGWEEKK
jgi:hypothetical protein